ncbi:hypothetical protein IU11_14000 [Cellulosimicrobium sp. MM]|nr:hypothetical protein [Cellulosimicrobium sp. MM]KFD43150.1 hypothetical protein IU11_14000 [Cellulosimicrobium sp. MM]
MDEPVLIGWVTFEEARAQWPDAPVDDDELGEYLLAAYDQCIAYSGYSVAAVAYSRHRRAQIMQARALWRAAEAGDNNGLGPDGFTVTVFPMDWTVKSLLRPKTPGSIHFGARS